jgi:hypothetical protein
MPGPRKVDLEWIDRAAQARLGVVGVEWADQAMRARLEWGSGFLGVWSDDQGERTREERRRRWEAK